jgi:hypothetical protein
MRHAEYGFAGIDFGRQIPGIYGSEIYEIDP